MLRQRLWASWLVQGASFALLAWLLYPVLRNVHQFNEPAASLLLCWIAVLFAVGLSVLQTPVLTRGFHITDILMRMAGGCAGLLSRRVYDHTIEDWDRARRHDLTRRLARVCFASVCAFILYTGLIPWLQQDGRGHALGALASYEVLPLYSYFHSRFDVMAQDIVQKTTAYVLFGGLLVMSWRRVEAYPLARRVFTVAQAAVALALVIEVAQLYLLIRVTSLTDLLIAALAGGTGVVVQEHAVTFYRFARSKDAVPRPTASTLAALGPTDELIATLAEPHPEAPTEEVPARKRRLPSRR
jgi:glycopeptide antibiotics resistance protein